MLATTGAFLAKLNVSVVDDRIMITGYRGEAYVSDFTLLMEISHARKLMKDLPLAIEQASACAAENVPV